MSDDAQDPLHDPSLFEQMVSEWQPIATAPTDGRQILGLWWVIDEYHGSGKVLPEYQVVRGHKDGETTTWSTKGYRVKPVYWRNLPAAETLYRALVGSHA